jgi:hypothetical protein
VPTLQAGLARLGACAPFARAAALLADFTRVTVSEPTARRLTERAGAAYAAVQTAEAERLLRDAPPPPPGPATQQLSVDGAMVPLVGGAWAEVKTLAVGTVVPAPAPDDPAAVRAGELSYFSRLAPAEEFGRLAVAETHRRGVETAGRVAAVADGAEWCQGFVDVHRPDAIRILDQPHAVAHLGAAAAACLGEGTAAAAAWLAQQAAELTTGDPAAVLAALRDLPTATAREPAAAAAARDATLAYLGARRDQIRYAEFRALGLPIGSGAVESANKLVVEARLKGAGMRWARAHVDPMLALRTAEGNGRWDEAWPQITGQVREQARRRTRTRRLARAPAPPPAAAPPAAPAPPGPAAIPRLPPSGRPKRVVDGRPTAAHPWKRAVRPPQPAPTPITEL